MYMQEKKKYVVRFLFLFISLLIQYFLIKILVVKFLCGCFVLRQNKDWVTVFC